MLSIVDFEILYLDSDAIIWKITPFRDYEVWRQVKCQNCGSFHLGCEKQYPGEPEALKKWLVANCKECNYAFQLIETE